LKRARHAALVIFGALLGVTIAIFISSNRAQVQLFFLDWQLQDPAPMWLFAAVCALVGMVTPRLLFWGLFWERYQARRDLKRKVASLEREVVRLRNLPLNDLPPKPERGHPAQTRAGKRARTQPTPEAADFDYDAFLGHSTASEPPPEEGWGQPEILPASGELDDSYAAAFSGEDPAVADLDEAHIYVSVRDSSAHTEEG
jgi:uncharacterized integral membrane protein